MNKFLFFFLLLMGTAIYAQDAPKFCQLNDQNTRFAEMKGDSGKKVITMITYIDCKPQKQGKAQVSSFTVIAKYDLSFFRKKEVIGRLYINDSLYTGFLNVVTNPDSASKMVKLQFREGNCERAAALANPYLVNKPTATAPTSPQNTPAIDKSKSASPNKPNPAADNHFKAIKQDAIFYFPQLLEGEFFFC